MSFGMLFSEIAGRWGIEGSKARLGGPTSICCTMGVVSTMQYGHDAALDEMALQQLKQLKSIREGDASR